MILNLMLRKLKNKEKNIILYKLLMINSQLKNILIINSKK